MPFSLSRSSRCFTAVVDKFSRSPISLNVGNKPLSHSIALIARIVSTSSLLLNFCRIIGRLHYLTAIRLGTLLLTLPVPIQLEMRLLASIWLFPLFYSFRYFRSSLSNLADKAVRRYSASLTRSNSHIYLSRTLQSSEIVVSIFALVISFDCGTSLLYTIECVLHR
jgi:hypothetical protein